MIRRSTKGATAGLSLPRWILPGSVKRRSPRVGGGRMEKWGAKECVVHRQTR